MIRKRLKMINAYQVFLGVSIGVALIGAGVIAKSGIEYCKTEKEIRNTMKRLEQISEEIKRELYQKEELVDQVMN